MKRFTILSSRPYGRQDIPQPLTEYEIELESELGFRETQRYACTDSQRETVINDALNAFCSARVGSTDPFAAARQ